MTGVVKFSQITLSGSAPALTDTVIGVGGGTTDLRYTVQQIQQAVGNAVGTARLPAAAATINILTSDIEVGVNPSSSAVTCNLPSVANWVLAQTNGLELTIFDYTGHAATNNISFVLSGTDVFVQSSTPIITSNFGLIKLRPILTSPNKWFVRGLN